MNERDYGIVVGIDQYPGLGSLEGAQRDAESFAGWLVDPDGGGLPEGNVRMVLTRQFHPPPPTCTDQANPNTQRFYSEVRGLLMDAAGNLRPFPIGRRLYLYFSGHGFLGSSNWEEAALYAANASRALPEHIPGTREASAYSEKIPVPIRNELIGPLNELLSFVASKNASADVKRRLCALEAILYLLDPYDAVHDRYGLLGYQDDAIVIRDAYAQVFASST